MYFTALQSIDRCVSMLCAIPPYSGDSSLLITVAAENEFPSGGVGGALTDQIASTAEAAGINVTVQVTRFGE